MKKILFLALLGLAPLLSGAQNLLNSEVYSFEKVAGKPAGWIAKTNLEVINISSDKAATGSLSLKFDGMNLDDKAFPKILMSHPDAKISLEAGEYTIKAKVFLEEGSTKQLTFVLVVGKAQIRHYLKLEGIESGKWVDVASTINVKEAVEAASIHIGLSGNSKYGGQAKLYLDDVQIVK